MHDLAGMLRDPHLVATDFFPVVDHPTEGKIRNMKVAATWSDTPVEPARGWRRGSMNTARKFLACRYSADEIAALIRDGVTTAAPATRD